MKYIVTTTFEIDSELAVEKPHNKEDVAKLVSNIWIELEMPLPVNITVGDGTDTNFSQEIQRN